LHRRGHSASSDPTAPTRVAHTLRGTAGNIGATALAQAAAAVEAACQQGGAGGVRSELLAAVERELAIVREGLRMLDPQGPTNGEPSDGSRLDHLGPLLLQLKQRLAESDAASLELAAKIEPLLAGHPRERASFGKVASRIQEFEFDEALKLLSAMTFPS